MGQHANVIAQWFKARSVFLGNRTREWESMAAIMGSAGNDCMRIATCGRKDLTCAAFSSIPAPSLFISARSVDEK
jgi:hypothetical protein